MYKNILNKWAVQFWYYSDLRAEVWVEARNQVTALLMAMAKKYQFEE